MFGVKEEVIVEEVNIKKPRKKAMARTKPAEGKSKKKTVEISSLKEKKIGAKNITSAKSKLGNKVTKKTSVIKKVSIKKTASKKLRRKK